jgi:hypothetical protein
MAPEIAKGRYGKEIDLYALGILLYELLTGHVPFEGESIGEVLMKHLTAEPDLSRLVEPYRSAVAACLAKDPEQRPKSVAQLLARLQAPQRSGAGAAQPDAVHPVAAPAGQDSPTAAPRLGGRLWPLLPRWQALSMPTKVLLALVALYLLLRTSPSPSHALLLSLAAIGTYWYLHAAEKSKSKGFAPAAPVSRLGSGRTARQVPQPASEPLPSLSPVPRAVREQPASKPARQRLAELLGAMLFATVIAAALLVVVSAVRGLPPSPQQMAWQWLVGTVGSWLVLVPAKCWEGRCGDDGRRRFLMLLLGLALGLFAWSVAGYLWVDFPYGDPIVHNVTGAVGPAAFEANGQPRLLAYLAYFGLLMLVPRWWMQADPGRRRRVNLWSTTVCVCYALVLNQFCAFPQPWAMFVAGTMSLAVQLASGWHGSPADAARRRHVAA